MKIIDISMVIEPDMPVYKNRQERSPGLIPVRDFEQGSVYETEMKMNLHTGTHIDAAKHVIPDGTTIETFRLEQVLTPCRVLDLTGVKAGIGRQDLAAHDISQGEFILCQTKNSLAEGSLINFIYLAEDGARYLVEQGIAGIGIDTLGIERDQPDHPTHKLLLNNQITVVEGIELQGVEPGRYTLLLAPLRIDNVEAAPARALLLPPDLQNG